MEASTARPERIQVEKCKPQTWLWAVIFVILLIVPPALENRNLNESIQDRFTSPITNTSYQLHPPIVIVGNNGFSSSNGVTAGSGKVADPYIITGWKIDASSGNGVTIVNTTSYFNIQGVSISSGVRGVFLDNATNGAVQNSVLANNAVGILGDHSTNISISNNLITGNAGASLEEGIEFNYCAGAVVTGNRISGLPQGLVLSFSSNSVVSNNTIWQNTDGVTLQNLAHVMVTGNNMSYNKDAGLTLASAPYTNITRNILTYNNIGINQGINVDSSPNVTLARNVVSWNSGDGIRIADNTTVINNSVSFNGGAGISIGGENTTVSSNTIAFNGLGGIVNSALTQGNAATIENNTFTDDGLFLNQVNHRQAMLHSITRDNLINGKPLYFYEGCSNLNINATTVGQLILMNCWNVHVTHVQISHTVVGMELLNVSYVTVTNSSFNSNTQTGIRIAGFSNVTLVGNDFSNNRIGLAVYTGNWLSPYHNNFFFDGGGACCYGDKNGVWDNGYPSGGNYWSDYKGVDNCSGPQQNICPNPDGIGDTPLYVGLYGEADHYPLMKPYIPKPDTNRPTWLPNVPVLVTNITDNSATLNWIPASDDVAVASYQVLEGTGLIATIMASPFNSTYLPVPGYTYTVSNLSASTTYSFSIVAIDQAGNYEISDPVTIRTQAQTTPNGPIGSILLQYWYLWIVAGVGITAAVLGFLKLRRRKASNPTTLADTPAGLHSCKV